MHGTRRNQRAIGIQIIGGAADGAGKLVGVVTDRSTNRVAAPISEPLPYIAVDRVIDAIERLLGRLRGDMAQDDQLLGVGIEIAGLLHKGIVVNAPALGWQNVPLAKRLRPLVDSDIVLVNDANALAVYERDFPDAHGVSDPEHFVVVLLTEIGIGSGLILNGRLYEGAKGMAGELGHTTVDGDHETADDCQCGKKGCLQNVATVSAIDRALDANEFRGGYQAALAQPENEKVREVFTSAGAALGRGLSTVVNLFNPSAIVIYGQAGILGTPHRFHIDAADPVDGAAGHYMGAMATSLNRHVFERAADDCILIVRTEDDHRGAEAAAACAIDMAGLGRY